MNAPFGSEDQTTNWAIDWLRARGFAITRPAAPVEKLRCAELCQRLGLKFCTLHTRLYHRDCPIYRSEVSPTGRILWLWLTPELHTWLSRPLAPGKRPRSAIFTVDPQAANGEPGWKGTL